MSPATVGAAAHRIVEHARRHHIRHVAVVLHGGEPLLLGAQGLRRILGELRSVIEPVVALSLHVQSNGVRLTPAVCKVLAEHHVKIGISLDGDEPANDRHRRFADGRSSHRQVGRALELLRTPPYRAVYGGLLCTVDVANDPDAVYTALLAEEPPRIDLLLPHATWERPPPRRGRSPTPYADWLLAIFDRWTIDGRTVSIRTFDSVLSLERGGTSGTESLGSGTPPVAVVETDGSWEHVDSLKVVSADTPATGLDVVLHTVDDVVARGLALRPGDGPPRACRPCPVVSTCGGGLLAHRFRRVNGFDNPSVYCADLRALISGIRQRRAAERAVGAAVGDPPGLPDAVLHALVCGRPSQAALEHLAAVEYALDRALLAHLAPRATDPADQQAWEMVSALDQSHPVAVRSVLSHPYLRVRMRRRRALTGLVASVAAAVAVRAGVDASVVVPTYHEALCLPGVGTLGLPGAERAVVVTAAGGWTVCPDGGGPAVTVTTGHVDGWHPVRPAVGGASVSWDDADPDRDCFSCPVLPTSAVDTARDHGLPRAWSEVRAAVPAQADQLDALVRIVTPARARAHGPAVATTTRTAFGAVALGPAPPVVTATLLVREAARMAVRAVQDVVHLADAHEPVATLGAFAGRAAVIELANARADAIDVTAASDRLRADLTALAGTRGWTLSGRILLDALRYRVTAW